MHAEAERNSGPTVPVRRDFLAPWKSSSCTVLLKLLRRRGRDLLQHRLRWWKIASISPLVFPPGMV